MSEGPGDVRRVSNSGSDLTQDQDDGDAVRELWHLGRKVHAKPVKVAPQAIIDAKEAIDMLSPQFCSRKAAKEHLVDLLRDKRIKLYAQRYWVADEADPRLMWDTLSPDDAQTNVRIRKGIFSRTTTLSADAENWDWERGRFFVSLGGGKLALIEECGFEEREVSNELLLKAAKGKGGRKRDELMHLELWVRIVEVACDKGRSAFTRRQSAANAVIEQLKSVGGPKWTEKRREGVRSTLDQKLSKVRNHLGLAKKSR